MRRVVIGFIALLVLFILADVSARLLGVVDFPLYLNSRTLGYVPAPNQRGAFLHKNDWAFNNVSMGVAQDFAPGPGPNTLLIGDSIVYGGNHFKQDEKLGPTLQRMSCGLVWPASAESWAFLNELRYVRAHSDIAQAFTRIIFVLNSGDFGDASVWTSEITNPTHYPVSTIAFLARRIFESTPNPPPTGDNDWRTALQWLLDDYRGPITFALYPNRAENGQGDELNSFAELLRPYLSNRVDILLVGGDQRWRSPINYRDEIHPTNDGNKILARILAPAIRECRDK
jgi:hypothetical protein